MPRKLKQPITYCVRWEIDVEAVNALDAAREARRLQVGPRTTARVFDAWPRDVPAKVRRVDLCSERTDASEPSDIVLSIIDASPVSSMT